MKFRTRAKTAYGYLTAIAAIIMEEPKRLNMGIVALRGDGLERYLSELFSRAILRQRRPSCGTVGCVAGWALILAGRTSDNEYNKRSFDGATSLLGLTNEQAGELFLPLALVHAPNQQTRAHAVATVKHIQKFQKKYAAQLKRTIINPRLLGAAS